jgi:DNA-binding PadR family transcriptional regulator
MRLSNDGPKFIRAQSKKRLLERQVLAYLAKHGASLYDALFIHFDTLRTTKIQPVLHGLKEYGYIEVAPDKMVTITTFGLQHLDSSTRQT